MPDPLHAEPFHADGAPGGPGAGVLLVHGFTSTPASMTPWAEHLAGAGFRVSVPVLPGHGTVWQDLNRTGWQDWYAEVDRAFLELRGHGEPVFVAGLSMGGGLALRLAEERPDEVAGLDAGQPVGARPRQTPARDSPAQAPDRFGRRHQERHQEARRRRGGLRPAPPQGARLVARAVEENPRRPAASNRPGRRVPFGRRPCRAVTLVAGRPPGGRLGRRVGAGAGRELPRRGARQRRPADLRGVGGVRPAACWPPDVGAGDAL